MKACALVLARGSSKSIRNKNILKLNGIPLISYVLLPAENCKLFDEIWVSTDDDLIERTVRTLHPTVKVFRRSSKFAQDNCSSIDAVKEFLLFKKDVNVICLIQATSPCLHPKYLQQAYKLLLDNNYDSVFSVTRDHKLRWTQCENKQTMKAVNFDPFHRPRRQDWAGEIVESGHFYLATRELIESKNLLQNEFNSGFVQIPVEMSFEIDNEWQIPVAELLLRNHGYLSLASELRSKL